MTLLRRPFPAGLLGLTVLLSAGLVAQIPVQSTDPGSFAATLFQQQRWEEVVRYAESLTVRSVDLDYSYGMALAKLQRWDEAARVFRAAARKAPADKRFPIELAGVAFRRQQYGLAAAELRKARRLDPRDPYVNDFLGTVYFLEENLPAALKYWNRVEKPLVGEVASEPQPRTDAALLDTAFVFSPAGVLRASDFQLTEQRLELLQVFPRYRFELLPKEDGSFDLLFRPSERNGWGDSKLEALLRLFRNLPFQTITPEFFNRGGQAVNLLGLVRWDTKKQRASFSASAPLHRDAKWRYGVHVDGRNERWNISDAAAAATGVAQELVLKKVEAGADIASVTSARWSWKTGITVSQRDFGTAGLDPAFDEFLRNGIQLKYSAQLDTNLLTLPERRFTLTSSTAVERAKLWGERATSFTKTTAALYASWFPSARGDDYQTSAQLRWGKAMGRVPFDELFILGMDRDTDLWMHAHSGTRDGMKGSAPMGAHFVLVNWEFNKNVRQDGIFNVSLGPVLDAGRFIDESQILGSRRWLCDLGIQFKIRVFGGVGIALSYARDLRSGGNVFYARALP